MSLTGRFVWYELLTSDPQAAIAFYTHVIGWKAAPSPVGGEAYTILSAGEAGIAGLMELPAEAREMGARPLWMGYVAVDDVDGFAERVVAAGGSLKRPGTDIPSVGRFAVVADPQGAPFALFTPPSASDGPPPATPGTPGHMGWHELLAADRESAFEFYAGFFGWTKGESIDMGEMGIYQLFSIDGIPVGGMMTKPPHVPGAFWVYYINVEALDAAIARATEQGGKVILGPMQVPGGSWVANCMDPQGVVFAMVSMQK